MIVPTWLLMIHTVGCKHYRGSSNKPAIIPGNAVCLFTPTQTQSVLLNYFLDSSSLYFSVFSPLQLLAEMYISASRLQVCLSPSSPLQALRGDGELCSLQ